jgi:hypothetical protein
MALPAELQQVLETKYGALTNTKSLNGKSGANVHRLYFTQKSVVVKQTFNSAEIEFYLQIAPILSAHAIHLPAVELTYQDAGTYWLVVEDIPDSLLSERWHGDKDITHTLARLHCIDAALIPLSSTRFIPIWDDAITNNALLCFEPTSGGETASKLRKLQYRSQHLFKQTCAISGDPNPTNWGIRRNGTLVLFDWERFALATPAIDLAITIGGLGSIEQFRNVAATYIHIREAMGQRYAHSVQALTRNIALAKLWTILEYLGLYTVGKLKPDPTLDYLKQHLLTWLDSVNL